MLTKLDVRDWIHGIPSCPVGMDLAPYLVFFVIVGGLMVASAAESGEDEGAWPIVFTMALLIAMFIVAFLFCRLEVTVDPENVTAAFGHGWPKKVIPLDDIVAVREVRNTWWHGWGIRRITNGWMYNVWGLDAVEIEVAGEVVFRAGTDDARGLAAGLLLRSSQPP